MHAGLRVAGSADRSGGLPVRVGVPLADVYLEFLAGRCRPNTVVAAGYDLKVFFSVVGKSPEDVAPADVLAFITAQRTASPGVRRRGGAGGTRWRAGRRVSRDGAPPPFDRVGVLRVLAGPAVTCRPIRCRGDCRPAGSGLVQGRVSRWSASGLGVHRIASSLRGLGSRPLATRPCLTHRSHCENRSRTRPLIRPGQ